MKNTWKFRNTLTQTKKIHFFFYCLISCHSEIWGIGNMVTYNELLHKIWAMMIFILMDICYLIFKNIKLSVEKSLCTDIKITFLIVGKDQCTSLLHLQKSHHWLIFVVAWWTEVCATRQLSEVHHGNEFILGLRSGLPKPATLNLI